MFSATEMDTKQQLKRMGKVELLKILEKLEQENQDLFDEKQKLEDENQRLLDKVDRLEKQIVETEETPQQAPGTLADTAVKVNGVMEAAQAAADQYLSNIRKMEQLKKQKTREIIAAAQDKANDIIQMAEQKKAMVEDQSEKILQNLQVEVDSLLGRANQEFKMPSSGTPKQQDMKGTTTVWDPSMEQHSTVGTEIPDYSPKTDYAPKAYDEPVTTGVVQPNAPEGGDVVVDDEMKGLLQDLKKLRQEIETPNGEADAGMPDGDVVRLGDE